MSVEVTIERSKLVQALSDGFITRADDFERLIPADHYLTLIISDGPFTVPDNIGGSAVLASTQLAGPGVILMEWLTRA